MKKSEFQLSTTLSGHRGCTKTYIVGSRRASCCFLVWAPEPWSIRFLQGKVIRNTAGIFSLRLAFQHSLSETTSKKRIRRSLQTSRSPSGRFRSFSRFLIFFVLTVSYQLLPRYVPLSTNHGCVHSSHSHRYDIYTSPSTPRSTHYVEKTSKIQR